MYLPLWAGEEPQGLTEDEKPVERGRVTSGPHESMSVRKERRKGDFVHTKIHNYPYVFFLLKGLFMCLSMNPKTRRAYKMAYSRY
jgi:hypothetical protein